MDVCCGCLIPMLSILVLQLVDRVTGTWKWSDEWFCTKSRSFVFVNFEKKNKFYSNTDHTNKQSGKDLLFMLTSIISCL